MCHSPDDFRHYGRFNANVFRHDELRETEFLCLTTREEWTGQPDDYLDFSELRWVKDRVYRFRHVGVIGHRSSPIFQRRRERGRYGRGMICVECKSGRHDECDGCTCQHRTEYVEPVYSERVAASISAGSVPALVLNADMPPGGEC